MKTFICLATAGAALAASAQNEAMSNYVGSASPDFSPVISYQAGPVGWSFTSLADISVTALGAFSYVVTGSGGLGISLWDARTGNDLLLGAGALMVVVTRRRP